MSREAEVTEPTEKLSGWNYRVIATVNQNGDVDMEVYEVYYSEDGIPNSWTEDAVTFGGETVEDVARALTNAAADALRYPPLKIVDDKLVEYEGRGA